MLHQANWRTRSPSASSTHSPGCIVAQQCYCTCCSECTRLHPWNLFLTFSPFSMDCLFPWYTHLQFPRLHRSGTCLYRSSTRNTAELDMECSSMTSRNCMIPCQGVYAPSSLWLAVTRNIDSTCCFCFIALKLWSFSPASVCNMWIFFTFC